MTAAETPVRVFHRLAEGRPQGRAATTAQIAEQGWTWLVLYSDWAEPGFLWVCPGCGAGYLAMIGDEPVSGWEAPRWTLTGPEDALTASPSLGCRRWRDGDCSTGHYWLRDGKLVPA